MKKNRIQYTVRGVPAPINRLLREKTRREGKSLNQVILEVIVRGLGLTQDVPKYHDLDDLVDTWVHDPVFDQTIAEMDRVDPELWK